MEASKNLRRPTNWQDFETLCKKLWGEIWNCPEIKKNGRNGQNQNGVDVCGIPFGEQNYYGIQCKGKDEYTNKQFTEAEISIEIAKAKLFIPPLKKFYFATTAVKDGAIEEFVRKINIENKTNGFFEIHIFSWEDIVELIDENRQTHDWYVKSQNFKSSKSVSVTFQKGLSELILMPKFKRVVPYNKQKIVPQNPYNNPLLDFNNKLRNYNSYINTLLYEPTKSGTKINLSYCEFCFEIHNTGLDPIEEYKMSFNFEGDIKRLAHKNEKSPLPIIGIYNQRIYNVTFPNTQMAGQVIPEKKILVGDDTFVSDYIFMKPFPKDYEILVIWKLISKDFRDEGTLKLLIKPEFERELNEVLVEDPSLVGIKEGDEFQDYIIDKKEKH